ncbi:MAG: hypothetical protein HOL22_00190 [Euryarchaeota archaeon]|jgi:hypothetical protein|nr:hypothetical protein [Euryarchaeota archaeon]MBT5594980.1 hypothetical protein [Euryarchaeota archaeon]MBT6641181.1 hypothetical protein [Euryarchaeota archaeon]MBT6844572.1 hypothetical protein [Euryarchaeota archaeon]MBT7064427.1 hypothetical protein [Euryarchaeota archaeon]
MAWPFSGNADKNRDADAELTEERLKIMANIAIEQVPLPEEGELSEEDAWTISPSPTRARMNSLGSVPTVAATLAPTAPAQTSTTVDTSGLERLISSRLDMVEDVLRMVEVRLEAPQAAPVMDAEGNPVEGLEAVGDEAMMGGDTIVTASGEVIPVSGVDRMMNDDSAPLVELYEAQALAANPFLHAPSSGGTADANRVGAPTVSALLLDSMSGMAAVSFAQKAISSGMLSDEEGRAVLAIVQLAAPGESEAALDDHLSHKELLVFSSLVSSWRSVKTLRGEN